MVFMFSLRFLAEAFVVWNRRREAVFEADRHSEVTPRRVEPHISHRDQPLALRRPTEPAARSAIASWLSGTIARRELCR